MMEKLNMKAMRERFPDGAITQSVLLARGWTKGMIDTLLPEATLAKWYKGYVKVWDFSTVRRIEDMQSRLRQITKQ